MLEFILVAALTLAANYAIYRVAYRLGYDDGQLAARLARRPLATDAVSVGIDHALAAAAGYSLGLRHGKQITQPGSDSQEVQKEPETQATLLLG